MNVREIAFHSLLAICRDNGYSNIVVSQAIQKHVLTDRDRRFYTELVYGTLRYINYLDWIISRISSRRLNQLDITCLVIVRLGLYQLFGMSKIPESAACNESVKLAVRFGNKGMAKFVNALLRNSIRRREELNIPPRENNIVLYLSLTYHQPEWLIRRWLSLYGPEETEMMCRYFDGIPTLCLRTNTTRISRSELLNRLKREGIRAEQARLSPEGVYLPDIPDLRGFSVLQEGLAIIQDEPSQLVAHVLDPQPGDIIFDVCAAPGGKTTHIAALGGPECTVYGSDIYQHKLRLIENNAKQLGLSNIRTLLKDACLIGDSFAGKADRVLVDAPCSGLGVLRHKIDLRWRKKPEDLKRLPVLQRRILDSASRCVKPGGILVYSTCTINDEENTDIVQQFLQTHKDFSLDNAADYCTAEQKGPYIQILPQRDGLDGFFIARLKRRDA